MALASSLLVLLMGLGVATPLRVVGQVVVAPAEGDRTAADTLLAAANLPGLFDGVSGALQDQLRRMAADLPAGPAFRIREAVEKHFTRALLHEAAVSSLLSSATPGRLQAVESSLASGPVAEVRRIAAGYLPSLAFEEYVAQLTDQPPPTSRVELALRLARAQGAGPFYLVLAETLRGAAHMALRVFDPERPGFTGIPQEQADELVEIQDRQAAFILLYRYDTVPEDLLRQAVEFYESEPGRWYVEALSRAMTDALLAAAERMSEELAGLPD